jgi:hypothetical protein
MSTPQFLADFIDGAINTLIPSLLLAVIVYGLC